MALAICVPILKIVPRKQLAIRRCTYYNTYMTKYSGKITTAGNSKAIRLDASLFKSHGEFRRDANVSAAIIGPGQMLVSVVGKPIADDVESDPVLGAFLAFLERDIKEHPERLSVIGEDEMAHLRELVKGVVVDPNDVMPDDFTL